MNRSPWRHRYVALALSVAAVWVTSTSLGPRVARAGQSSDLDSAAALFWAAASEEDFSAAINAVLATDLDIEAIWSRLRGGRTCSPDVPTGRQVLSRRNRDGVEHGYVLHVPDDYDPATRYPVRVYLHGGVMRPQRDDGGWVAQRRRAGARRLDHRDPRLVGGIDLVADEPDRKPRRCGQRREARLQRRRKPGLSPRDLRRGDRRPSITGSRRRPRGPAC